MKLLALDIDDTLVSTGKLPSERLKHAIRLAEQNGVTVVLATGRGFLGSKKIRESLSVYGPLIHYGGAVVSDGRTGEHLFVNYLRPEDVITAFAIADAFGIHAQIYEEDTVIFRKANAFTERYTGVLNIPFLVDPNLLYRPLDNIPKVLFAVDPAREAELFQEIRALLPRHLSVLCSKPGFIEIGSVSSTKGSALKKVAAMLGVPREEVTAIGDNTLDLDMIEWAGTGVCVANANPLVKEKADLVIGSCDDDGVAEYLESLFA
ncbi:MAG: Cof-type HAD-IIB family hydrolase [Clostridia bacterium]|jgi:Cof subfamily protein (haloacid dehalogenase superfamily)|nr:Cof-type HAD-IIB family hydrolase [Clostridia bacterium]